MSENITFDVYWRKHLYLDKYIGNHLNENLKKEDLVVKQVAWALQQIAEEKPHLVSFNDAKLVYLFIKDFSLPIFQNFIDLSSFTNTNSSLLPLIRAKDLTQSECSFNVNLQVQLAEDQNFMLLSPLPEIRKRERENKRDKTVLLFPFSFCIN